MKEKFSFRLSDNILYSEIDKKITFHAELKNDEYEVTWVSEDDPMCVPARYSLKGAEDAISDGYWIVVE